METYVALGINQSVHGTTTKLPLRSARALIRQGIFAARLKKAEAFGYILTGFI